MNENPEIDKLFRNIFGVINRRPEMRDPILHILMQAMSFESAFHCLETELQNLQNKTINGPSCVPLYDPLMQVKKVSLLILVRWNRFRNICCPSGELFCDNRCNSSICLDQEGPKRHCIDDHWLETTAKDIIFRHSDKIAFCLMALSIFLLALLLFVFCHRMRRNRLGQTTRLKVRRK